LWELIELNLIGIYIYIYIYIYEFFLIIIKLKTVKKKTKCGGFRSTLRSGWATPENRSGWLGHLQLIAGWSSYPRPPVSVLVITLRHITLRHQGWFKIFVYYFLIGLNFLDWVKKKGQIKPEYNFNLKDQFKQVFQI